MTPETIRIFVNTNEGVTKTSYLHSDAVNIEGYKNATRVSDVEFDAPSQNWVATLRDGREIARDPKRDVVLQAERDVIDRMIAAGEKIPAYNCPVFPHENPESIWLGHFENSDLYFLECSVDHQKNLKVLIVGGPRENDWILQAPALITNQSDSRLFEALKRAQQKNLISI